MPPGWSRPATVSRVTATVLFTDVVGSTESRGRLGEEAAEQLRRRHDRLLTEAVEANNGRVVKGLGDGIMATFGGAVNAVAAAVAIQQGIDRLNRTGKAPVSLGVRVGLSAGDVTFEDEDVHGMPVIEAARLCAVAGGGEIVVSEVVRLLAGLTEDNVAHRGALELKGLQNPVSACEIRWEALAVSTIPMPALLTDVGRIFVGRDAELERLTQLWKEAAAGERRVAFLAGEPGVGKTRLAAELAMRVHQDGGVVLAGRCDEDLGVPYQPFVEALRQFVDHTRDDELKDRLGRYGGELVRLVPELATRVSDLPPTLASDPETERYRLFDAVAAWLAAMVVDSPMLVVLDDLQWAAKPTLLLLRHVIRSPEVYGVFFVGTYRDTDTGHDHPLAEVLADMRRQGGVERMSVRGLDPSGVSAYMEQAAGRRLDDEDLDLSRAVFEETEGNPFFVREVFRHLAETGAIERRAGRWRTRLPLEELGIPESVRDVVGRRLSRLSDDANRVLRVAAVVGPEFDLSIVRMVAGIDENAVISAVEEATGARLVIEATNVADRYRFAHALVRDTLYGGLSRSRRIALHRHVAQAIEAVHVARLDDHLPALAYHWARAAAPAADVTKAVDYATRAGNRALSQLAHDEAATYYRQAIDLLPIRAENARQRVDLLIALGEAQRRAGYPVHRETLLEAARDATRAGDRAALARAALSNSRGFLVSVAGQIDEERIAMLRMALSGAEDDTTRARLLANLAMELMYAHDFEGRDRASQEALQLARRAADPATLAHVLTGRINAITMPHTLNERLTLTAELVELADRLGDPAVSSRAWFLRYRVALEAGDTTQSNRAVEAFTELATTLGEPTLRWAKSWIQTGRLLYAGQIPEADAEANAALQLGRASGQADAAYIFNYALFAIRYEQGRLGELEEMWREMAVEYPGVSAISPTLAMLYCELGRDDDARRLLNGLATSEYHVPSDVLWSPAVARWAAVVAHLGDREGAAVLRKWLAPYEAQLVFPAGGIILGAVANYLGLLAATLKDYQQANDYFAMAAAVHDRTEAPAWLARTHLEWARTLLVGAELRHGERARQLLGQALDTARKFGLVNVEQRAVLLLQDGS